MISLYRTSLVAALGVLVVSGAVFLASRANAVLSPVLIAVGELGTGEDGGKAKGAMPESGAKIALGNNANAVLSLDLIADGGSGNQRDDGVTTGAVSRLIPTWSSMSIVAMRRPTLLRCRKGEPACSPIRGCWQSPRSR